MPSGIRDLLLPFFFGLLEAVFLPAADNEVMLVDGVVFLLPCNISSEEVRAAFRSASSLMLKMSLPDGVLAESSSPSEAVAGPSSSSPPSREDEDE